MKDLDDRDGLAEAIGKLTWHAGRRDADGLVVYKLDRLARDLIIQEQMLATSGASTPKSSPPQRASRSTCGTTQTTLLGR